MLGQDCFPATKLHLLPEPLSDEELTQKIAATNRSLAIFTHPASLYDPKLGLTVPATHAPPNGSTLVHLNADLS